MKSILFYIEPFPIRDSMTHFKDIINHFYEAIIQNKNQNIKTLIYSNYETISEIIQVHPKLSSYVLIPDEIDQHFFKQCLVPWENEGINLWQNLFKESDLTNIFVDIIKKINSNHKLDYIVYWGTNFAIQKASMQLGIGVIAMELGCSRPPFLNSIVADPLGSNGDSITANSNITDYESIIPNNSYIDLFSSNDLNNRFYTQNFNYICNDFLKINLHKRIFFFPLQLFDDANILQFSNFKSIKDVLEYVLPKLDKNNDIIIIKEHPASKFRKGAMYANLEAKNYALQFDNIIYLDQNFTEINNSQLINISDCIITVNSSVGFESLYFNKPVIVLGKASYKVKNVFPKLEDYLNNNFDIKKYQLNIAKIRKFFINFYLLDTNIMQDPNLFLNYLIYLGNINKTKPSIKQIINNLIRERSKQEYFSNL